MAMTPGSRVEQGAGTDDTEYTYVCPICGYTNDRRINAAQHLVNRHMHCVKVQEAIEAGGEPGKFGNQWRKQPDLEQLEVSQ